MVTRCTKPTKSTTYLNNNFGFTYPDSHLRFKTLNAQQKPPLKPKTQRMKPIVQISLDLTDIDEALETAVMALRAGVDWLEAGTPFILAEGLHGVKKLREAFPGVSIVAELKTMDGCYLEADIMAKAGATHVAVIASTNEETITFHLTAGNHYCV